MKFEKRTAIIASVATVVAASTTYISYYLFKKYRAPKQVVEEQPKQEEEIKT